MTALRWQVIAVFAAFAAVFFLLAISSSRMDTDIPISFGIGCTAIVVQAWRCIR